MASIGIGVGFNALFKMLEPAWVPKAISSLFVLLGMLIIVMAERRACAVKARLDAHSVTSLPTINLRVIAIAVCAGAACLIGGIWTLT